MTTSEPSPPRGLHSMMGGEVLGRCAGSTEPVDGVGDGATGAESVERVRSLRDDASAQEVYDFVAAHLLRQGEQSKDDVSCLYRDEEGRSCAVGCLIPDAVYSDSMEGDLDDLVHGYGPRLPSFFKRHFRLLRDLQEVHDRSSPYWWQRNLLQTAVAYDLRPYIAAGDHGPSTSSPSPPECAPTTNTDRAPQASPVTRPTTPAQVTDEHREEARKFREWLVKYGVSFVAACFTEEEVDEHLAQALASAEQRGMERAAEAVIAARMDNPQSQFGRDFNLTCDELAAAIRRTQP